MAWDKQGFDKNMIRRVEIDEKKGDDSIHGKRMESRTFPFALQLKTTDQRDSMIRPLEGLIIYNITTNRINVYTGSKWLEIIVSTSTSSSSSSSSSSSISTTTT